MNEQLSGEEALGGETCGKGGIWRMSGDCDDGCIKVAAAVIEQTVRDVSNRRASQRRDACRAISSGALEPWIDLLCETYDVYDSVHERLARLLREHGS